MEKDEKIKKFKDNAGNQRKKIKELKRDDQMNDNEEEIGGEYEEVLPKARLTEENLKKQDVAVAESQR